MKKIDINHFVNDLGINIPPITKFEELGNATSLYHDNGNFYKLNFERGILLYALISKYKPKNILEFGTAAGFSTLCMAYALDENKIDGKIFTIDINSLNEKHTRPVHFENNKQELQNISIKEIWEKIAKPEWIKKIEILQGYTGEIFNSYDFPKIDFGYIDGAHFYDGVKHDFYSFLTVASPNFGILFDDYIERKQYGIKKLLDEIDSEFNITLIDTDLNRDLLKLKMTQDKNYGMCWLDFYDSNSLSEFKSISDLSNFIKKYRKFETRLRLRSNLNQKIPFLKNIRLSFWK